MDWKSFQIIALIVAALLVAAEVQAQEILPAPDEPPPRLSLDELTNMALKRNPRLQRLAFAIDSGRGRALQAGLYPNPQLGVSGEELGGRQGSGGIITGPFITQEIVTAGKLRLSRAVLERRVDQDTLSLISERYVLLATVRRGYFDVLTIQRRAEILDQLVALSTTSVETAQRLVDAHEIAELDLLQFRVERNRFRAERDAAKRELTATFTRMAANLGVPDLPVAPLKDLFTLPDPQYEFEPARELVASVHPQLRAAQVGVSRAQAALQRAEAEPFPNVIVGAGYQRHNKDHEDNWAFQVGISIPIFNDNQGNISAARAEINQENRRVRETGNELTGQLAEAFGDYKAARERVDQYRTDILPDARKAHQLSMVAFQGGEFQYLRVLQAQRTIAETNLEYVRALGEMWKAAGDISGLLLEEDWPPIQPPIQRMPPEPPARTDDP